MENNIELGTWLLQQSPALIIACVVLYFMYKHMNQQLKLKQNQIDNKDEHIKVLNRESKEDLQKSFDVLQDVTGTLKVWLEKDDQNFTLKKNINESLQNITNICTKIEQKIEG